MYESVLYYILQSDNSYFFLYIFWLSDQLPFWTTFIPNISKIRNKKILMNIQYLFYQENTKSKLNKCWTPIKSVKDNGI